MPNWVFNHLLAEGPQEDIDKLKTQLNKPFSKTHDSWNIETKQMELKETKYSNPVFAFHNIFNHTQAGISDEEYLKQPNHALGEPITFDGNNWYDWNVRNWGTKWDVANHDGDEYPDTEITSEGTGMIGYRFNTAWSPPVEVIEKLSAQYPKIEFELSFEEEQGWGGAITFINGEGTETESYDNKCRDCDSINTMEYCESDCGEICSDCNYLGEADLEAVAECQTHMKYLDSEHVPDYRLENIDV